ncbi:MAG: hypothetical protein DHS20C20_33180 [Ardenticatenaceae bacterium]|nr:MAG: hypothetical protein DHS20C20_33180 [Ardenticatenaceae bacterium]
MEKRLTIFIDEQGYEGLQNIADIDSFVEDLIRPFILNKELDAAYEQMSQDKNRGSEALEWTKAILYPNN